MAYNFTLTVVPEGAFERLGSNLSSVGRVVEGELENALDDLAEFAEDRMKSHAPKTSGRLRDSIDTDIRRLEREVGSDLPYALYVEKGRGPGKPPPMQATGKGYGIERWAGFVGKSRGEAFAVARAIGARGVVGKPFVEPTLRDLENNFWRIASKVTDGIAGFIVS